MHGNAGAKFKKSLNTVHAGIHIVGVQFEVQKACNVVKIEVQNVGPPNIYLRNNSWRCAVFRIGHWVSCRHVTRDMPSDIACDFKCINVETIVNGTWSLIAKMKQFFVISLPA